MHANGDNHARGDKCAHTASKYNTVSQINVFQTKIKRANFRTAHPCLHTPLTAKNMFAAIYNIDKPSMRLSCFIKL